MNNRIRQIIEYYGISIRAFEQKIFISEGTIYRGLTRNSDFSSSVLVKILNNCPDISTEWLVLGKGEMLRESAPETPSDATIDRFLKRIENLARENGQLQAENAELKKEVARLGSAPTASAMVAAG